MHQRRHTTPERFPATKPATSPTAPVLRPPRIPAACPCPCMVGIADTHKAIRAIAAVAKLCKIFVASSGTTDDLAPNGCHDAMGLAVLCQILAPRPRKVRHVPAKARHVPAKARRREPCREYRRRLRGDAGLGSGILTRMEAVPGLARATILGPGRARATILGPLSRRLKIQTIPPQDFRAQPCHFGKISLAVSKRNL